MHGRAARRAAHSGADKGTMRDRLRFFLNRIGERLWVKPLAVALLSILGAFAAKTADNTGIGEFVSDISSESIETLLSIISSSMLVIATFAVGSMVSAYASASTTATPRAFPLVIADDVSQNALSTFIGAFIFSIIALIALKNGYYDKAGRFALFSLTLLVFAAVIFTFVHWVDRIARLGRMGAIIDKVERATRTALQRRRRVPNLRGVPVPHTRAGGKAIHGDSIGYIQRIDMSALQACAQSAGLRVTLDALPGSFASPGRALAHVRADDDNPGTPVPEAEIARIASAFIIGNDRTFDEDPRFGLVALSEIAARALSPAVNDPGTAIKIIGTFVRLFVLWTAPLKEDEADAPTCDRIEVPDLLLADMFDDAFTAVARDGAGMVEVANRLQKAFASLAAANHGVMKEAAGHHARLAMSRAESALSLAEDVELVRNSATCIRST
jgi:uncharacterized membrane protein